MSLKVRGNAAGLARTTASPARARAMALGDSRSADRPAIARVGGGSGTSKVRIMRGRLPRLALLKADLNGGHRRTHLPVVYLLRNFSAALDLASLLRPLARRRRRAPTRSGQSPSPMCRGGHVTAADEPPTTPGNTVPSERRLPLR